MVVAELGAVEKQQQESQPPAWPDEDDDTGGEQPISSPPGEALSGTHLTFSCRAVVDGMHRQAGDAQRRRTFQTVAQKGGKRGKRQEKEWESRRLGGGLGFVFFAGPGEEHGRRRRRCPLRERLREEREDHRLPQEHVYKIHNIHAYVFNTHTAAVYCNSLQCNKN